MRCSFPAGTFSPGGDVECADCQSGQYSADLADSCTPCTWQFRLSGREYMRVCVLSRTHPYVCERFDVTADDAPVHLFSLGPAGYVNAMTGQGSSYQSQAGNTSCLSCPAGRYSPNQGATYCPLSSCSAGQYSPGGLAVQCTNCSIGRYSNTNNAISCLMCTHCWRFPFT